MEKIKFYYSQNPLKTILLVALLVRLLASFFSKGYAFHDDHFDVIRVAQNWAYGLPHWIESSTPPKHSMVYPAFNACIIWLMDMFGATDPVFKTTVLRILHAFYSLLVVLFAFKITQIISNNKNAIHVAWIVSLLWFMPYLSVKFLAELVCVPPVLYAFYLILKSDKQRGRGIIKYLVSGVFFAIAFSIRMHTVLFAGGLGLALLFEKKWSQSIYFTLGFLAAAFIFIGIPDILFFEYPFQYVVNYFAYNAENANNYTTGSPFKFLLTTFGFLVPPVSVMLMWGFIKAWNVNRKIFLAVLVFFIVHSLFPNKQERFILPMYPLLIIMGVIGWNQFIKSSDIWTRFPKAISRCWMFFWIVNGIASIALALTYSKKDRVAPIHYLSKKADLSSLIVESSRANSKQVPVYYLGRLAADYKDFQKGDILGMNDIRSSGKYLDSGMPFVFVLGSSKSVTDLKQEMKTVNREPNYIVFKGSEELPERIQRVMPLFPGKDFILETSVEPSSFDKLLHILNPRRHRNETAHIYRVE
ncbi:MAG: glycosyltransferase family 39 protein [Bacteroidota bacterium]